MQIAILLSLCSKKQDWVKLADCDFIKIFLDNFMMTKSNKHKYVIYLGYDENDEFFLSKKTELEKRFNKSNGNIKIVIQVLPKICNSNPCEAWNILYKSAIENSSNDYFYQCGTDIIHTCIGWDDYFIKILQKSDNIGIIGGVDTNFWIERQLHEQSGILENVFTGRDHYERFGWFFPPEVKTWFSDDLITKIYRNVGLCYICPNIKYINTNRVGGSNEKSRYVPPEQEKIATSWYNYADKYSSIGFKGDEKEFNKLAIYN
jgi:hypothetical protein|tara:strand:- start:284 stop:1066 length:783 start_codon:yes stop_codon:yes gene_type:complete